MIEDICSQRVFDAGTCTASPRRRSFGQPVLPAEWRLVRVGVLFGRVVRQVKCGPTLHARDFAPLRFAKRVMLTLGRIFKEVWSLFTEFSTCSLGVENQ